MAYRFPGRSQTASDGCLFFFISVKEFESPKSPERRFCISGNVIFESRSLFLENLTLFFDFGLFCCKIREKATQKCGFQLVEKRPDLEGTRQAAKFEERYI